jgi:hypothetical protein
MVCCIHDMGKGVNHSGDTLLLFSNLYQEALSWKVSEHSAAHTTGGGPRKDGRSAIDPDGVLDVTVDYWYNTCFVRNVRSDGVREL